MRSKVENPIEPGSLYEEDTPGGLRRKAHASAQGEGAICKLGEETNPISTFVLDSHLPEL